MSCAVHLVKGVVTKIEFLFLTTIPSHTSAYHVMGPMQLELRHMASNSMASNLLTLNIKTIY